MLQQIKVAGTQGARLPALRVLASLFDELNAQGIRYCHWKSTHGLPKPLGGATDLDLLVDRAHSRRCRTHAASFRRSRIILGSTSRPAAWRICISTTGWCWARSLSRTMISHWSAACSTTHIWSWACACRCLSWRSLCWRCAPCSSTALGAASRPRPVPSSRTC
jgi:hypothetical protein